MKKEKGLSVVILVALLLLAVTLMDTWILYTQTQSQTKQSGSYQLESVSGRLEANIGDAKNLTTEMALAAREYLADVGALEAFIYEAKERIVGYDVGAFNLYIANGDFCIIPGFDIPSDFVVTDRVWYTGAIRNGGGPYVSSPYQDAMTGEICYSTSVMLGDGETVLGIDYTLEGIQSYIVQMSDDAVNAVIVTDEGVIAGCSDESLVGERLVDAIPDYAGIYNGARTKDGVTTGRVKEGIFYENLFAASSSGGWILIVGISDWGLYKNAYVQLFGTIVLSLALFSIIIVLYLGTLGSREKAEEALRSREEFLSRITGEFSEPLKGILEHSDMERFGRAEDYEEEMAYIHSAGERLSETLSQVMSYKSIVLVGDKSAGKTTERTMGLDKRFRTLILAVMVVVMVVSLYTNISSAYSLGNARMRGVANEYAFHLSEWIDTQKSILDMFTSTISTNPEMLSDYEGTVAYLEKVTRQYPEISVTYMTNPLLEHTVYMSNGWEPDADWHVEERQWYVDTLASKDGWSISAPYYDEQTGGYCVTLSKIVNDAETGEFLGIFGIDFFMEKLIDILGGSYTETGYSFLVDPEGEIINHPYGVYQMSMDGATNVSTLPYGEIRPDGKTTSLFKDYDGAYKILIAVRNEESNFSVYAVSDVWEIYGGVVVYGLVCLGAFLFCIFLVYRLLTDLIRWQERTNGELKEAVDAAVSAGKAKSSFLAQMSHEIRTPINAVLGMNEMILRESGDEEIREYAENIRSAGRTLLSLINSILDFSKIEDGKMELVPVKYDTSSMINDLVNSISERARNKGLDFVLNVDPAIPCTMFGDDVRIRQVIMNLLTNAVKYTENGSVTLSISGEKPSERQFRLRVSVRDTGIGIRDEDRDKLFESFARLDETRNRNIEGTGLGMSIVTRLLALMGTSLNVESEYGKGSDFSFELLQDVMNWEPIGDFTERLGKSMERDEEEKYLFANGARVLVVDDNDMNRKVARSLMKRNGIVPDEAASGFEAIDKMAFGKYDVVFLDHMMPKMDGIETLRKLKEGNLVPEGCVVIALTANAVSGARDRYIENGFDDYLSKPIDVAQLEKKLAKWLPEGKVGWRSAGEKAVEGVQDKAGIASGILLEDAPKSVQGKVEEVEGVAREKAGDVLEFTPKDEGEVFEFAPEKEGNDIFEFAPENDGDGVLEFSPDGDGDSLEFDVCETGFEGGAAGSSDALRPALEGLGLDVDSALGFCGGDFGLYGEILGDYVAASRGSAAELTACLENADWREFEVKVHAVKSASRTIGAKELAEKALLLENAAERRDADFITENYAPFAAEYKDFTDKLGRVVGNG